MTKFNLTMAEKGSYTTQKSFKSDSDDTDQSYAHRLIWLDQHTKKYEVEQNIELWRELDDGIKIFTDTNECINYFKRQDDKKTKPFIILIISESLCREVLSKTHDFICILAIFVFSSQTGSREWLKFSKVQAICSTATEVHNRIKNHIMRDNIPLGFSLLNQQDTRDTGNCS